VSVQPRPWPVVPEVTARVARAAFPKGCLAMRVRDELGALFADEEFVVAFGVRGRPGWSPGRLALVSVLQFAESLTDRQAADQVRGRIDWKYALGLELEDAGFDHTVLTGFRSRLIEHGLEEKVLDVVLARLSEVGMLRCGGRVRTDSTHVLAAVRSLNRLELVTETLRAALEAIAEAAPDWLATQIDPGWVTRYGARADNYRLPKRASERTRWAVAVGRDGFSLLHAVAAPQAPPGLVEIPQVQTLRIAWIQQYHRTTTGTGMEVAWRENSDLPPGRVRLASPYDPDARYGVKRGSGWLGYKLHLTETCTPTDPTDAGDASDSADAAGGVGWGGPGLITNVETTDATVSDHEMTEVIHRRLARHQRLPAEHVVDSGYTSAALLLSSPADYGITLLGPVAPDPTWQARTPDAFDVSDFHLDWDTRQARCPAGKSSSRWSTETLPGGTHRTKIDFRRSDCSPCPLRPHCTTSRTQPRKLTLRPRAEHHALHTARAAQTTPAWKQRYAIRAGIESTIHQAITTGARRTRYHGLPKTHLAHILTATAINLHRLNTWWTHPTPTTRKPNHLTRLKPHPHPTTK
jgi:transposase